MDADEGRGGGGRRVPACRSGRRHLLRSSSPIFIFLPKSSPMPARSLASLARHLSMCSSGSPSRPTRGRPARREPPSSERGMGTLFVPDLWCLRFQSVVRERGSGRRRRGASVVVLQHVDAPLPPTSLAALSLALKSFVRWFVGSFGPWQDHNSIIIG